MNNSAATSSTASAVQAGERCELRLLIVEDTPLDAELILASLHSDFPTLSYDVVDSRERYLELLHARAYDVILADHNLITWTGLEALEILRKSGKTVPLIVVTGSLGDENAVAYIKSGAADYVQKDNLKRIPTVIKRVLDDISKGKELGYKIERAEREWERTFDAVPDPIFLLGEDCRIVRCNMAAANTFGVPFPEIIGKYCYEVIHGRSDPLPTCPHQNLLKTGQASEGDIEEARLDKTFHSSTSLLKALDGSIQGYLHVLHDVTFRKQMERALRDSEEKFAAIFKYSPEAIALTGFPDGQILDVNEPLAHLTGFKRQELIGRTDLDLGFWPEPEVRDRILALVDQKGFVEDVELTIRIKTGETRSLAYSGKKVEIHGRSCLISVVRDVTERKRTFENIRRQSLVFENMNDAVIVVDENRKIVDWNQAATRIYGYAKQEVLGQKPWIINKPEFAVTELPAVLSQLAEAGRWHGEMQFVGKDGREGICEMVIVPLRNENGIEIAQIGVSRDVTERKRAENALLESERKYRELIENASYGIVRSKQDGTLLDINPAFMAMLGYESKEELLQLNFETDIYEKPEERRRILHNYQSSRGRVRTETCFRRKDGSLVHVQLDGREILNVDDTDRHFEVFVADVTEQKALEEQFRQSQKMEAVGRLAGGIAHDFNNVLMVINSYAEMIASRNIEDPKINRYVDQIVQGAQKAASLTGKLLAFSRKQVLQPAVLDLQVLVSEFKNMIAPMLGEDIEVTSTAESNLGNVYADRSQIEQVLMNLTVNARDAMSNGGKLHFDLRNVTVEPPVDAPGAYVVLSISDSGIGMDAATQERIFEPFYTTKGVGKGTGLGLSTVYGILKQSGGFVRVKSEPGNGTTFDVYLPLVNQKSDAPLPLGINKKEYACQGETVLLVDDEPELRAAAREFLESEGYHVLEAGNGAGALGICAAYKMPIHVLVTDLVMPGVRGAELAAKISTLYPGIKTIFMSGYANRSQDVEMLGRGVDFLQKPFSLNALAEKLNAALHGNSGASVQADTSR